MADKPDISGLKRIGGVPAALNAAIIAACREYATRGYRAQPIVYQHFTQGNQGRYQWAALSPNYADWKAGVTKQKKADMKAAKRVVPKGRALPMLVLSGRLRDAITSGRATISKTGPETFIIVWPNDPPYAIYLHRGTPKMPKRSPVEPNAADQKQIIDAANRALSIALGTGGSVAVGGAPGARARVR
jgi:hypothetical protein